MLSFHNKKIVNNKDRIFFPKKESRVGSSLLGTKALSEFAGALELCNSLWSKAKRTNHFRIEPASDDLVDSDAPTRKPARQPAAL